MRLEIKRTSITRLKRGTDGNRPPTPCALEIKRTSITRLKLEEKVPLFVPVFAWNQKNLDYEIETRVHFWCRWFFRGTWNQKNLDYEIETLLPVSRAHHTGVLEIKRTSITRLKRILQYPQAYSCLCLKSKEPRLRDWNGSKLPVLGVASPSLEIKRTSITRLKHNCVLLSIRAVYLCSWNQKNLDYEIET